MWHRRDIKRISADTLAQYNYWDAFFVCLIIGMVLSGTTLFAGAYLLGYSLLKGKAIWGSAFLWACSLLMETSVYSVLPHWMDYVDLITPAGLAVALVFVAIAHIFSAFVCGPFQVGQARYFLDNRHEYTRVRKVLEPFKHGYRRAVGCMFIKSVKILLWSFVPCMDIVKSYEYLFVDYILAENPSISRKRAFQISRAMTQGQKVDIIVMELSIIGLPGLGGLICFLAYNYSAWIWRHSLSFLMVLIFWIMVFILMRMQPYRLSAIAQLYAVLREDALERGYATQEELPGIENAKAIKSRE